MVARTVLIRKIRDPSGGMLFGRPCLISLGARGYYRFLVSASPKVVIFCTWSSSFERRVPRMHR